MDVDICVAKAHTVTMSTTYTDLRAALGPLADVAVPHLRGEYFYSRRGLTELGKAHDADIDMTGVFADGYELFGYQRAGVAFARAAQRCVIGYGRGLGKTPISIATLVSERAYPALVVCPPTLVRNWQREFAKFSPDTTTHVVTGTETSALPAVDVVIIGDAVLADWQHVLVRYGFEALVVDEIQRFKSRRADRVKALLNVSRWIPGYRLGLTGTFAKNGPGDVLAPLRALGVLDSVFSDGPDLVLRPEQLNAVMADTCYARLTLDDVADQMGAAAPQGVLRNPVAIGLTGAAGAAYRAARDDIRSYLRDNDRTLPEVRHNGIVRMGVLRRLIAEAKLEATIEFVQDLVDQGDQVVVFAVHRAITAKLAAAFNAPTIRGGDSPDDIERGKDGFQSGEHRVIVLNIEAGGTGHTLTAARHVVFVEFAPSAADMEQCEGRADRIGQTQIVQSHWLIGANGEPTIDERYIDIINAKAMLTGMVNDGKAYTMLSKNEVDDALLDWAEAA